MTIFQMKVIVLTAETGSISAAARSLNISQPNASNCIKLLEEELGFSVFIRDKSGIAMTSKGEMLVEHAKILLGESEKIQSLSNYDNIFRLRLGSVNYHTLMDPFLTLCEKHRDDPYTDVCYSCISVDEGLAALASHKLDVVIIPCLLPQIEPLHMSCDKMHIKITKMCRIPACINLRKDHPAVLEGLCNNIEPGCDTLKDYPYVAYKNLFADSPETNYNDTTFIKNKYIMYANDAESRLRLIASTNGFGFGSAQTQSYLDRFGLVSFNIPGIYLDVFVLQRDHDVIHKEVDEYLKLLDMELSKIKVQE